jgi:release factor glutamine methyltransferase
MGAALSAPTIAAALAEATARLARAGVAEARADAEVLLAFVLGTTRTDLVVAARRPLPETAAARFTGLVARRAAREPVQHLTGEREFWSLPLAVDRRVLVPRPESELVVETALRLAPAAGRILDVGTGSGAIAVALARELPAATVYATDREADALAVARRNAATHAPGVRLVRADLLAGFASAGFDLVVSNPPYVPTAEIATLAPEVRDHEPPGALDGGHDGLDVVRALLAAAPRVLRPGGWLVLEVGSGQADAVQADDVWTVMEKVRDHAGIERVVAARSGTDEGRGGRWRRS